MYASQIFTDSIGREEGGFRFNNLLVLNPRPENNLFLKERGYKKAMSRATQLRRKFEMENNRSRRIVPLPYDEAKGLLPKKGKPRQLPELEKYRKIIQEKKKHYQQMLRKRAEVAVDQGSDSSGEQSESSCWGWFIDPSEVYKFTFK